MNFKNSDPVETGLSSDARIIMTKVDMNWNLKKLAAICSSYNAGLQKITKPLSSDSALR